MNGQKIELNQPALAVQNMLRNMSSATYDVAEDHGFIAQQQECPRELLFAAAHIALIQSECSEALEIIRTGDLNQPSKKVEGITALQDEFADIIIRVLMLSKILSVDVGEGVVVKHAYNSTREYRHGGKMF
jgi:NTP pyrophosphatase (non-canonical NTP hydrolase)